MPRETTNQLMSRYGIPNVLLVSLASTAHSPIFNSDTSEWRAGRPLARHKAERLQTVLAELVGMLDDSRLPYTNLRDTNGVRKSLAKWRELRAADKRHDTEAPHRIFAVAVPLPTAARGSGMANESVLQDAVVEGEFTEKGEPPACAS